jgi:hypothetical protein
MKALLEMSLPAANDGGKMRASPTLAELPGECLRYAIAEATGRAEEVAKNMSTSLCEV